jgi:hypothetical protein
VVVSVFVMESWRVSLEVRRHPKVWSPNTSKVAPHEHFVGDGMMAIRSLCWSNSVNDSLGILFDAVGFWGGCAVRWL